MIVETAQTLGTDIDTYDLAVSQWDTCSSPEGFAGTCRFFSIFGKSFLRRFQFNAAIFRGMTVIESILLVGQKIGSLLAAFSISPSFLMTIIVLPLQRCSGRNFFVLEGAFEVASQFNLSGIALPGDEKHFSPRTLNGVFFFPTQLPCVTYRSETLCSVVHPIFDFS